MHDRDQQKLQVFRRLYETHASSLIRFAKRYTSARVAEDLVQDVFLEIWKNDKILEEAYSRSYLYTAVQNRCVNFLKLEQHKKTYIDHTVADEQRINFFDFSDTEGESERIQRIHQQIERLPEKCRQIFKLSYIEEMKSAEIADLLKLSIRTVEYQLYIGLKTLRDRLLK